MDNALDFLIKKSDLDNNEYFNYRHKKSVEPVFKAKYSKITVPSEKDYVVFDLETTGMSKEKNKIIEIGAIKVKSNEIVGTFNVLVDPETPITGYVSKLTNITNEMVKDKSNIDEVFPLFYNFIEKLPLMAHNASFDMGFILYDAQRLGFDLNNKVIDTLKLSRTYNKECKKHNLGYLTEYFNIKLDNAHRAYFDALATFELYKIVQRKYLNQSRYNNK